MIVQPVVEPMEHYTALILNTTSPTALPVAEAGKKSLKSSWEMPPEG